MPYIKQELRPDLDEIVELFGKAKFKFGGDLQYILFNYCRDHVKPSYNNYKNYRGELFEAAKEIKRRIGWPSTHLKISTIYHKSDSRFLKHLDPIINLMKEKNVQANEDLNYILFAFCKRYVTVCIKDYVYAILEARKQIGKELLEPYEDLKEQENGTI